MFHWDAGKVVAYLGGAIVSLLSIHEKRQVDSETVTLLDLDIQAFTLEVTLVDVTTLGGFLIIVLRFVFDIYRYRQKRKDIERESQQRTTEHTDE